MPPDNSGSLIARAALRAWCMLALLLCVTAALLPHTTEAALTDGLVGHWTFDGADVTDKVYDRSGQGNNSYFFGGATSSAKTIGKLGQAFSFDGVDDGVRNYTTIPYISAGTMAFWMKDNGSPNGAMILSWSFFRGCIRTGSGGDLELTCSGDGFPSDINSDNPVFGDGQWHHVVFTFTNGNQVLYIDGVQQASIGTGGVAADDGDMYIGGGDFGATPYKGLLDDVRLYNRQLSPAEAKQLYLFGQALQKPPNNLGLVGYWSFNEGVGTIATDFSGNGNTGTFVNNPAWISGKRGSALGLESSSDNVTVPSVSSLHPTTNLSLGGWVKISTVSNTNRLVFGSADGGSGYQLLVNGEFFECAADSIGFWISRGGDFCASYALTNFSPGEWNHVFATYDGETVFLYLNGVQVASDPGPSGAIDYNSTAFCVGNRSSSASACLQGSTNFDGSVDEVRVYNRVLTPAEIARIHQSGAVKIGASSVDLQRGSALGSGLVGHWTFDGADVTDKVYDRSGQGNHGYFVGAATSTAKVQGKLGQALGFDGVDDEVNSGTSVSFSTTQATLAFWMKDSGNTPDGAAIVAWAPPRYCGKGSGLLVCSVDDGFHHADATAQVFDRNWHHVVWVMRDRNSSLYVDGVFQATESVANIDTTAGNIIGGTRPFALFYNGRLDDVRVYNRALTPAEVKRLYQLGTVIIRQ